MRLSATSPKANLQQSYAGDPAPTHQVCSLPSLLGETWTDLSEFQFLQSDTEMWGSGGRGQEAVARREESSALPARSGRLLCRVVVPAWCPHRGEPPRKGQEALHDCALTGG